MAQIAFSLKYDLWVTHWEYKIYTFWEGHLAILFTFKKIYTSDEAAIPPLGSNIWTYFHSCIKLEVTVGRN